MINPALLPPLGLPVIVDKDAPKERVDEDGNLVPVLATMFNGRLYVHPDRWEVFKALTGDPQ